MRTAGLLEAATDMLAACEAVAAMHCQPGDPRTYVDRIGAMDKVRAAITKGRPAIARQRRLAVAAGSVTSAAKRRAARANGKRGGRPRKTHTRDAAAAIAKGLNNG